MTLHRIRPAALAAALLTTLLALTGPLAAHARAAGSQVTMFEVPLQADPDGVFEQLRVLGVQVIRVPIRWYQVAPQHRPARFNASSPGSPGYSWGLYDAFITDAARYGLAVEIDVTGQLWQWAEGPGVPANSRPYGNWEPNAAAFGQFVHAVGERYSGTYRPPGATAPLPRVSLWSIWNEPDYGPSLAPQGLPGHLTIDYAPLMYRRLVDAAWSALVATGHGPQKHDKIIFGEVAPRGMPYWGVFSGMTPMVFVRSLYCVDSRYRPLRGSAARVRGCPTTAAGTRSFARQNPALFQAAGFADHPYMRWYTPNREPSPDPVTHQSTANYATLGTIGTLERGLDRAMRVYGSHRHLPIYDTEFGYITSPPKRRWKGDEYPWVSQSTAAYYLNWAEYIHWHDPRIASFFQYLLYDPAPAIKQDDFGGYASGLIAYSGVPKADYYAWRMPLYLPVTTTRRGHSLEVWGCVRPAHFAVYEAGPQTVQIQVAPGTHPSNAAFRTVATATIDGASNCYFDRRVRFPRHGTETVRLQWSYPDEDPLGYFDPVATGALIFSRHVEIDLK